MAKVVWPLTHNELWATFGDLSSGLWDRLMRGGYATREAVAQTSDEELIARARLGPKLLEEARRKMPPGTTRSWVCPQCEGRGTQYDPPAASMRDPRRGAS